ncbi:MAG: sigma-70 family RNA polymerase sigma factor [bacterium]
MDFSKVYDDHKELVWRLVSRYVASQHDREDLFQEIFLRINQALSKFRGQAKIETWIYRIAANTAINFVKKQQRYSWFKRTLELLRKEDAEEKEDGDGLFEPLKKLNPRQRMILVLAEVEEKKLEEIGEMLKLPVGTVKSNLHRAKEILKKELKDHDRT